VVKQLRLVFAVPVVAIGFWAVAASACDQKSTSASAASTDQAACSQMSAAECKAKMAGHTCSVHGASAANASAVTASATGGCPYSGAAASASGCSHATATSASAPGCAGHATTTSAASGACSAHTVNAMTVSNTPAGVNMYAAAHAGCAAKATGATAGCAEHSVTMAAGLGSTCSGRAAAATAAREGCEACSDLAHAEAELEAAGATMQTVPIKNGVMFVYTAASPGQVNAIQSVMSRRTDHLSRILASGDKAHLCDDCREMRGAMVSGRLVREVVNIEGGTLVLVTSEDPTLIRRIRDLADAGKTAVKS
jgi:hypothetical protein